MFHALATEWMTYANVAHFTGVDKLLAAKEVLKVVSMKARNALVQKGGTNWTTLMTLTTVSRCVWRNDGHLYDKLLHQHPHAARHIQLLAASPAAVPAQRLGWRLFE